MTGGGQATDAPDRVMLDIETLGAAPGAAILSIGAVTFGLDGIGREFYYSISLQSCEDAGLAIDAGTLDWWLQQDDGAREVLTGGIDLDDALRNFALFSADADEIWAYSPSFDCAILSHAYDATDYDVPWTYQQERDCRTLAALSVWPDIEQDGTEHDALDDARYQARQTAAALRALRDAPSGGDE